MWAGPLAYVIKTTLATFVIAAILQPFRGQRKRALRAESARAATLHSTLSQMFLDKWDKCFGQRFTTAQVGCLNQALLWCVSAALTLLLSFLRRQHALQFMKDAARQAA